MIPHTRARLLAAAYNLTDPVDARTFIEDLRRYEIPQATFVETDRGRRIYFTRMSDADACEVARILYKIVAEQAAEMEKC